MSREQFNQLSVNTNAIVLQDPSALNYVGQAGSPAVAKDGTQNGTNHQGGASTLYSKKLQDDLQAMGQKIKQHEQNVKFLKAERNRLDESILDMQVALGKYHAASTPVKENEGLSRVRSEEEIVEHILKHDKSAASIFLQLTTRHGTQASNLPATKDVLGVVATLGKVDDDNLSRLLSEYLGLETMLSVVCKNIDGVKALETYDKDGAINTSSGMHGIGASIGQHLDGRFIVICLESLRPYVGEFIADDPQKRLDLLKPRLQNGETPPGFVGFAVNMINLDIMNLACVTNSGHGLRETLFYHLFSSLQVYKTREEMFQALPCISNGAVSLDGGIIKRNGIFSLGKRVDLGVMFPKSSVRFNLPDNYFDTENRIKEKKWKKDRVLEDMRREQDLLDRTRFDFEIKKQELLKFLAQSSSYVTQVSPSVETPGTAVRPNTCARSVKALIQLQEARLEPRTTVRKEKLGDRITALQQLVSPFGKTDTASVVHEAIEYIKFLHDQVTVFSSPYLKNGPPSQRPQTTSVLKPLDLRSRGLCLVPISSTFPVAVEITSDFWTPSFGGAAAVAFR